MKKISFAVMALIVVPWQPVLSQHLEFEVQYDLSTYTLYNVAEEHIDELHTQDTIKLLPESVIEHIKEGFYDDGTSFSDVTYTYPIPLLERWISPVDRITTTSNRIDAYVNSELMYTEDLLVDEADLIPPISFAAFYLGTNNWSLPINDNEVLQFDNAGLEVSVNDGVKLELRNDTSIVIYDKSDWSETYISLDLQGNQTKRKITFYKTNIEGYLLYDHIVTWSIDSRTQPCIEKFIYQHYTNINRIFHNPACAPTIENGFVHARVENYEHEWLSVHQLEGTNQVYIDIPKIEQQHVFGVIKDMYGIIVIDPFEISISDPYIDLGELPTGLYSVQLDVPNLLPCKFLYRP